MKYTFLFAIITLMVYPTCGQIGTEQPLKDIQILAADSLEGRKVGTKGGEMARAYIKSRFEAIGLEMLGGSYETTFEFEKGGKDFIGTNLIGVIPGKSEKVIVVSAHYDHLGIKDGNIFNGADDNASGVAGILAVASAYQSNPLDHTLIIAAFDGEESGLQGAKAFVKNPFVKLEDIIFNINLDMISHNDKNEIYAAGSYHYDVVKPIIEKVRKTSKVKIFLGHDSPNLGHNDWTNSSDHGPFHSKKIPFIYFGVEDHPDYHKPTDTYEKINPEFLLKVVNMIVETVAVVDKEID